MATPPGYSDFSAIVLARFSITCPILLCFEFSVFVLPLTYFLLALETVPSLTWDRALSLFDSNLIPGPISLLSRYGSLS